MTNYHFTGIFKFLSTLSLRRATKAELKAIADRYISIHALLAESDAFGPSRMAPCPYFYPRSPCGERRNARPETRQLCAISIHALLAESDRCRCRLVSRDRNFYPRSPCGERLRQVDRVSITRRFLSTLSLRRATGFSYFYIIKITDFYPRSPCGERRFARCRCWA